MYIKGIGTNADSREGVSWLTESAKNGWRSAMQVLGDAYEQGALGLKKDLGEARKWHEKANVTE